MQIEQMDRVVIGIRDVDGAANFLSEFLGTRFHRIQPVVRGRKRTAAISPLGIELVDILPQEKEGLRAVHFKVTDLEEARAEVKNRGIRIDHEVEIGHLRELLLNEEDCHGIRIGLISYDVPHGAVIAAAQEDESN